MKELRIMPAAGASVTLERKAARPLADSAESLAAAESFDKRFNGQIVMANGAMHRKGKVPVACADQYGRPQMLIRTAMPSAPDKKVVESYELPHGPIANSPLERQNTQELPSSKGPELCVPIVPDTPPQSGEEHVVSAANLVDRSERAEGKRKNVDTRISARVESGSADSDESAVHHKNGRVHAKVSAKHVIESNTGSGGGQVCGEAVYVTGSYVPAKQGEPSVKAANVTRSRARTSPTDSFLTMTKPQAANVESGVSKTTDASKADKATQKEIDIQSTATRETAQSKASTPEDKQRLSFSVDLSAPQKGQSDMVHSVGLMQPQKPLSAPIDGGRMSGGIAATPDRQSAAIVHGPAQTNGGHQILQATSRTLEVGVATGSHGWLRVRAEMTSDGRVNALVSSTSQAMQHVLHKELAPLATFLRNEQVEVGALFIHTGLIKPFEVYPEMAMGRGQSSQEEQQAHDEAKRGGSLPGPQSREMEGDGWREEENIVWPVVSLGNGSWLNVVA